MGDRALNPLALVLSQQNGPCVPLLCIICFCSYGSPKQCQSMEKDPQSPVACGESREDFHLCFSLLNTISKMAHLGSPKIQERDVCSDLQVQSWTMMSISVESFIALDVSYNDIIAA